MRRWDRNAVIYCKQCCNFVYLHAYYSSPQNKEERDINSEVNRDFNKYEKKGFKTAILEHYDGTWCRCRVSDENIQPSLLEAQP